MKNIKKVFGIIIALVALFGAAGCKVEMDNETKTLTVKARKVAVFYGGTDASNYVGNGVDCIVQIIVNFYSDYSYEVVGNVVAKGSNGKIAYDNWTQEKGTYTGAPASDGTVVLTTNYKYNSKTKKLEMVTPYNENFVITNGQTGYTEPGLSIKLVRKSNLED